MLMYQGLALIDAWQLTNQEMRFSIALSQPFEPAQAVLCMYFCSFWCIETYRAEFKLITGALTVLMYATCLRSNMSLLSDL